MKKSKWVYIANNSSDATETAINGWENSISDEDSVLIAVVIHETREVEYYDDDARTDESAQQMIKEVLNGLKSKERMISFKQFMDLYDNWNGITKVNDGNLNTIIEDASWVIMNKRKDLYNKKVVAFGFYDGVMTVRVK